MTKVLSRILVAVLILVGLTAQTYQPGQIAPFARFFPRSNQTTSPTDPFNALDPFGNAISCTGTTTQCFQEFITATASKGWPARAYCQGTQFPSATEPVFINVTATINVPVSQDWDFEADATCNLNSTVTTVPALSLDSEGSTHFRWNGKIVYNVTNPTESFSGTPSCAVYINPHTNTADGFAGLYGGLTYIKAIIPAPVVDQNITGAANNGSGAIRLTVGSTSAYSTNQHKQIAGVLGTTEANATWAITVVDSTHIDLNGSSFVHTYTSGGTVTSAIAGVICINTATGSTIEHTLSFQEINGNNVSDYGIVAYGASPTTGFMQNHVIAEQIHGAVVGGYQIGVSATNAGNYNGNIAVLENIEMAGVPATGLSPRGIDSWASNDIIDTGPINNAQGGLQFGFVFETSASNNHIRYGSISGAVTSSWVDNGTCNSIDGPQGSQFQLWGATSGCTPVKTSPVAPSTAITLPSMYMPLASNLGAL